MRQSGLMRYLLIYIFVIQLGIVGYLWADSAFYVLAGLNMLALGVGAWSFWSQPRTNHKSERELQEKTSAIAASLIQNGEKEAITEKKSDLFVRDNSLMKDEKYELHEEEILPPPSRETETKSSHSDIEHVKMRFNSINRKPQVQKEEWGMARLISFLLALVGFGGIMVIMRESFDFIAMGLAAALMALFLLVVYKAMNIWKKSIFKSLYFLFFLLILMGSIVGIFTTDHNTTKNQIKDQISTFFAGINWEVIEEPYEDDTTSQLSGYLYEISGSLITSTENTVVTGEISNTELTTTQTGIVEIQTGTLIPITPSKVEAKPQTPTVTTSTQNTTNSTLSNTGRNTLSSGDNQVTTPIQTTPTLTTWNTENTTQTETTPTAPSNPAPTPDGQVTLLTAIKHLISTYNIPLSKATNVQFTHVAQNSPDYPYMKTAMERKMIGTTNNPHATISCDVYIVLKGYALKWKTTANTKEAYRAAAVNKGALNGCEQGAKLSPANL